MREKKCARVPGSLTGAGFPLEGLLFSAGEGDNSECTEFLVPTLSDPDWTRERGLESP
jgi:hypothetical protein